SRAGWGAATIDLGLCQCASTLAVVPDRLPGVAAAMSPGGARREETLPIQEPSVDHRFHRGATGAVDVRLGAVSEGKGRRQNPPGVGASGAAAALRGDYRREGFGPRGRARAAVSGRHDAGFRSRLPGLPLVRQADRAAGVLRHPAALPRAHRGARGSAGGGPQPNCAFSRSAPRQPEIPHGAEAAAYRIARPGDGKTIILITNHFRLAATTLADVYRERWQIEVFFRALKQNLRLKSFVGTSQNAVQIQIWTALIAILLLKYLQLRSRFPWSLSNLVALLRQQLFVYRDLWTWIDAPFQPPPGLPPGPLQLNLQFT